MDEIKIEKRITREELRQIILGPGDLDESLDAMRKYQLQTLKDQQAKEPEYEIIQPKQLK